MSSLPATVPSILQRSFWACSALRLLLCSLLLTGSSALSSKQRVLHDTAGCNTSGNEAMSDNAGPWNDEFGELVQNYLDQFHVPSVAIAVVENKSISSTAYGFAKFPDVPATSDTLYYAGSTTKSFTAAALTMLIDDEDEGANRVKFGAPLNFQKPLIELVPEFRLQDDYATLHTTLEDALSHRSGLPAHDAVYGGKDYTFENLLQALPSLPLTTPFRTTFQYCNIMYMVVSRAIENLTGLPLGLFLGDRIWGPLRMSSTYFSLADAQRAESQEGKVLARGYFWDTSTESWTAERYLDEPVIAGAGNIVTTVNDYAEYLRVMIHKGYPFEGYPITAKGHDEIRRPRSIPAPGTEAPLGMFTTYGLGWLQTVYRGETIYWHNGGLHGFGALMAFIPSRGWGVTMLSNTELRSQFMQNTLMFKLIDDLLGVPQEERSDFAKAYLNMLEERHQSYVSAKQRLYPTVPNSPVKLTLPLEAYTGEYWHPAYRNLTLYLAEPTYPGSDQSSGSVLHFDMLERTWPSVFDFEHVSGEFFVAWKVPSKTSPTLLAEGAMKAEFRIGENGKVSQLGVAMDPLMGEEKIWWRKVE